MPRAVLQCPEAVVRATSIRAPRLNYRLRATSSGGSVGRARPPCASRPTAHMFPAQCCCFFSRFSVRLPDRAGYGQTESNVYFSNCFPWIVDVYICIVVFAFCLLRIGVALRFKTSIVSTGLGSRRCKRRLSSWKRRRARCRRSRRRSRSWRRCRRILRQARSTRAEKRVP